MHWLEYIKAFEGPVFFVFSFLVGVATLWVSSKTASKRDLEEINDKSAVVNLTLANHAGRISHIEDALNSPPTGKQLQDGLSVLSAKIAALEASNGGIQRQLATANDYLHTLVEKGLR